MSILFAFPGYELFADRIQDNPSFSGGDFTISSFPDRESLVTIHTDVKDKEVIIVCGLDRPNEKVIPILFFSHLAQELGAKRVGLIAPYLGYLRQDKRFSPGQAITSKTFAQLLSSHVDWLTTIDPHLHRYKSLNEIYTIPTTVLHTAPIVGSWVKDNVENPILIGPDEESLQWVQEVAEHAESPFIVLKKTRALDGTVEVSAPDLETHRDHTPVLVDDIISTAQTMIKTVGHLREFGMKPAVCVGIHAIFAGDAHNALKDAGAGQIVTTNTIQHETNEIDVSVLFG